jgi:hypothetical protein
VGKAEAGAGGVRASDPEAVRGRAGRDRGVCVMICLAARVSVTEESGAGKPHAGICAGGAG